MKVIYEKTIEGNNQLKVNVDEQQNDITDLKEQWYKDDEEKVQEISGAGPPWKRIILCLSHVKKCKEEKKMVEKSYHERAYDPV